MATKKKATASKKDAKENAVETATKVAAATTEKAKKAEAPKTEKTETKKTSAKKTTAKKTPSKRVPSAKAVAPVETEVKIFVEYNGVQVALDDVVKNVKAVHGADAKEINIYLKPQENKAYFTADGEAKAMDVYF